MRRNKPLRRKRATPRRSGRLHWPEYLDAVRQMPCFVCGKPGPSDPDHMGQRPYGRKADDETCVPMCRMCHRMRTDGDLPSGVDRWQRATKEEMRKWCDEAIKATQDVVLPMLEARGIKKPGGQG